MVPKALKMEGLLTYPNVRLSPLYDELVGGKLRCGVCERRCIIPLGEVGFCRTRMNIDGRLYTLVYGDISSISANPIEKKPFFHFWPGSSALTIGTWSCNFTCPWCQNYEISTSSPEPLKANYINPDKFVRIIEHERCHGCSISFNEPTMLFEYSLDVFPLARQAGFYNTFVSNGYMTLEALRMLRDAGMDAIKFDVKGCGEAVRKYCGADVNIVWRNVSEAKRLGMHVEVVMLVIPGVNDDEECLTSIAKRHLEEAGPESPIHFTQFYPTYKMMGKHRTPIETLEKAHRMAVAEGVKYVYAGNVPGHILENTYCPECGELLIERYGFSVKRYRITPEKKCPRCKLAIPIIGEYIKSSGISWIF
ncbi:MAG: AmmeMemoRadiSam system radical SAM enzyme [Candidatus Bathyarchaeia archaeon]